MVITSQEVKGDQLIMSSEFEPRITIVFLALQES